VIPLSSDIKEKSTLTDSKPSETGSLRHLVLSSCFAVITGLALWELYQSGSGNFFISDPSWDTTPAPLVMKGGDPYIRALMRTISASEANDPRPYSLLYGGEHVQDLSQHPDICIPISVGPNVGDCTTAAGRYQFLTSTWFDKAREYHPERSKLRFWGEAYSFAPEYQDEVVYAWLSDTNAWGVDIAQLLRQGQLSEVLWMLSPTWTSLGYGIETNSMSGSLPDIYQQVLQEELGSAP
jgi:muramidase (phage lysozyme)